MKKLLLSIFSLCLCLGSFGQHDGWNISTQQKENYTGIVVANGRLGLLPSSKIFGLEQVLLNNVYEKENELGVSKIVKGMNFGNLEMSLNGTKLDYQNTGNWSQTLHMKEASFSTSFDHGDLAKVTYTWYALRNVPFSAYLDIEVTALKDLDMKMVAKIETPADLKVKNTSYRVLRDLETTMPILQTVAKTRFDRHTVATSGTFIWHHINSTREHLRPHLAHSYLSEQAHELSFDYKIKKGEKLRFAWTAAQCSTQDFTDPQTESERFVIYNLLNPASSLLAQHKQLWASLWQGDIEIEGDLTTQQDVRLALYHLYSFGRAGTDLSIAPMGLSSQNYNGHIFWDTELWMFPPLLLFNQDIATSLVNYRYNGLAAAQKKAAAFGFAGAMYPWEADDTGTEATPAWALTGTFEHHITADVAIAFWNYYLVTKNKSWLAQKGYPVLKSIADYWASRVSSNNDGTYSILNVVGANEFAPNVDDNAFTNGSAKMALRYAHDAAQLLGEKPNDQWLKIAEKIRILKMPDGTTKEHSNYMGERIKQADANLLAFPLGVITDKAAVLRDLRYYEPKLAEEGPAMGKAIYAVLYARMGDAETAYRLFKEGYSPNKRPPFGALAEAATSNNPYFATGAGGLLQAVLFGFGGLHIEPSGIVQRNPVLPKTWKSITIKGVGPEKKTFVVK